MPADGESLKEEMSALLRGDMERAREKRSTSTVPEPRTAAPPEAPPAPSAEPEPAPSAEPEPAPSAEPEPAPRLRDRLFRRR